MKDGEIKTYQITDKNNRLIYLDEVSFNKKIKAIRKYSMNAYKYWIFEAAPKLRKENKKDGKYELDLPVNEIFKKVYGDVKILFSVKNDVVILEDILPNEILLDMHMKELKTYKGIPYRNTRDKYKIDLARMIKE